MRSNGVRSLTATERAPRSVVARATTDAESAGTFWHPGIVDRRTYRVTASTGGWRSLPWPFGLLEVDDNAIAIRSWHWSWWVTSRTAVRSEIEGIDTNRIFGVVRLRIRVRSGKPWTVQASTRRAQLLEDLRSRGYIEPERTTHNDPS